MFRCFVLQVLVVCLLVVVPRPRDVCLCTAQPIELSSEGYRHLRFGSFNLIKNYSRLSPEALYAVTQVMSGIHAAFHSGMLERTVDPSGKTTVSLEVQHVNGTLKSGNVTELVEDRKVNMGFLFVIFSGISAAINGSREFEWPLISGLSLNPYELLLPTDRQILNLRAPPLSELTHLYRYAITSHLRCTSFALVAHKTYIDGHRGIKDPTLQEMLDIVIDAMVRDGFQRPPILWLDDDVMEETPQQQAILKLAFEKPHCVIFSSAADIMIPVIGLFHEAQKQLGWPHDTQYLSSSFGAVPVYDQLDDFSIFQNLHVVQQVPDPDPGENSDFFVVQNYTKAMKVLAATDYNPWGYPVELTVPNYYALEGYVVGRFVLEVLRSMRLEDISPQAFIDTVYERETIKIDDLRYGPFVDKCVGNNANDCSLPFCNSGTRKLFLAKVSAKDGRLHGLEGRRRAEEVEDVSVLAIPPDTCYASLSNVKSPFLFLQFLNTTALSSWEQSYSSGLRRSYWALERKRVEDKNPLAAIALEQTNKTRKYRLVAALASNDSTVVPSEELPVLGRLWAELELADPPLVPYRQWKRWQVALDPVLADYVHTLVAHSVEMGSPISAVVGSSHSEADLGEKSSNTFALNPELFVVGTEAQTIQLLLSGKLNNEGVLVVSQRKDVVQALVKGWTQMGALFLATNEDTILSAVSVYRQESSPTGTSAAPAPAVYFASVLPRWWGNLSSADYSLVSMYRTQLDIAQGKEHPAELLAFRLALIMQKVAWAVSTPPNNTGVTIDALYRIGTVSTLDLSLGRFSDTPCTAQEVRQNTVDRTCQCAKGPRRFYSHSFHALAFADDESTITSPNSSYEYSITNCGVKYEPLPLDLPLIIGLSVGGFVLLLLVAGSAVFKFLTPRTKDNTAAPKDSSLPFAMVFTDIQTSTNLWARVPAEMSEAVEQHHALIRKLIRKHRGYEVKTIGDSFMVAFGSPSKALEFAVGIQLTFQEHKWNKAISKTYQDLAKETKTASPGEAFDELGGDSSTDGDGFSNNPLAAMPSDSAVLIRGLRVRVGVHYGYGEIRLDPVSLGYDYYGTVVNTAARVESVGHGGQVVATVAVIQACELRNWGNDDVICSSLGAHPLRGIDQPVELFDILPHSLSDRKFHPLRIDALSSSAKAEGVDELENDMEITSLSSGSTSLAEACSAEHLAERHIRSRALKGAVAEAAFHQIMLNYSLLTALLSTTTLRYKDSVLDHLAEKWRVPFPAARRQIGEVRWLDQLAMKIVLKVTPVSEESLVRRLGARQQQRDNLLGQVSSSSFSHRPWWDSSSGNFGNQQGHLSLVSYSGSNPQPSL